MSYTQLKQADIKRIIENKEATGLTVNEFIKEYGVSRASAYKLHKRYGEELGLKVIRNDRESCVIQFVTDNPGEYTIPAIARRFNLPQHSVYALCQRDNLPYKETARDKRLEKRQCVTKEPAFIVSGYSVEELAQMMRENTQEDIAKKFDVTPQAVSQWKKCYVEVKGYNVDGRPINIPKDFEQVVQCAVFKREVADYYDVTTYTLDKWLLTANVSFNHPPYPWLYEFGLTEHDLKPLGQRYSTKDLSQLFAVSEQTIRELFTNENWDVRSKPYSRGVGQVLTPLTLEERIKKTPIQCKARLYQCVGIK